MLIESTKSLADSITGSFAKLGFSRATEWVDSLMQQVELFWARGYSVSECLTRNTSACESPTNKLFSQCSLVPEQYYDRKIIIESVLGGKNFKLAVAGPREGALSVDLLLFTPDKMAVDEDYETRRVWMKVNKKVLERVACYNRETPKRELIVPGSMEQRIVLAQSFEHPVPAPWDFKESIELMRSVRLVYDGFLHYLAEREGYFEKKAEDIFQRGFELGAGSAR